MRVSGALESRIAASPEFIALSLEKQRVSLSLVAIVFASYFSLIFCVAFRPDLLARPIANHSVISVGVVAGVLIIFGGCLVTGAFVLWGNTRFDRLMRDVVEAAK